jgi:hypothetical protein
MLEREILGEIICEVSPEEARELWKSQPEDRWRLWTHDEVTAHLLSSPDTLRGVVEGKRQQPGYCLN